MIKREDIIEVGSFNKPHGINGEISATFDYDFDEMSGVSCYICDINGIYVPFFAEGSRPKNNQTILLKIEGMENDSDLKILINKKIYALKEEVVVDNEFSGEDDDELPLEYFIGYRIIDSSLGDIGVITDVDTTTDNFLFIIEKDDKQLFIPAVDDLIAEIDFDNKQLKMNLPEGILEM